MTPYIVSELASAHIGSPAVARELIKKSAESGVDGVKFQIWHRDEIRSHPRHANMVRFELSQDDWRGLSRYAQELGLHVWIELLTMKNLAFAESLNPYAYKMRSGLFSANPVKLAQMPVFWRVKSDKVHGVSCIAIGEQGYPTSWKEAQEEFKLIRHYSKNHTVMYAEHQSDNNPIGHASLAAYEAGADYLEKHICLNREVLKKESNDWCSALEPDEFTEYVQTLKSAERGGKVRHL